MLALSCALFDPNLWHAAQGLSTRFETFFHLKKK
jgi:hypothetical protein